MTKVLITGMTGAIGKLLREHLESVGGYELSALSRSPVEGVDSYQADISDLDAIRPAFEDKDVVVHLASDSSGRRGRPPVWESILNANIIGTRNAFEAARLAGVKRVVFASSGFASMGFESAPPYDSIVKGEWESFPTDVPKITHEQVCPASLYGATKVWGEALGRHYTDEYSLSILCVRIGAVMPDNRPTNPNLFSNYLSHRDVVSILRSCIDAPESVKYDIFFATSNNKLGYRDLQHPKDVLGWVPQDSADDFR